MSRLRRQPQNEDDLKNEDNLKNKGNLRKEDDLRNEDDLKYKDNLKKEDDFKNEDNLKMKTTSKIAPSPQIFFDPLPLEKLPEIFLMTSHHDSHTTTDVKPEMIPGL